MKREILILATIIVLVAVPLLWTIQYITLTTENKLARYSVYSVEFKPVEDKNVSIIYQIKDPEEINLNMLELDSKSKVEICYIVWYIYNHYSNVDEVQIISYYSRNDNLREYYKFKIDKDNAKLVGLLGISEEEITSNVFHYYNKVIKLGKLEIYYK